MFTRIIRLRLICGEEFDELARVPVAFRADINETLVYYIEKRERNKNSCKKKTFDSLSNAVRNLISRRLFYPQNVLVGLYAISRYTNGIK